MAHTHVAIIIVAVGQTRFIILGNIYYSIIYIILGWPQKLLLALAYRSCGVAVWLWSTVVGCRVCIHFRIRLRWMWMKANKTDEISWIIQFIMRYAVISIGTNDQRQSNRISWHFRVSCTETRNRQTLNEPLTNGIELNWTTSTFRKWQHFSFLSSQFVTQFSER